MPHHHQYVAVAPIEMTTRFEDINLKIEKFKCRRRKSGHLFGILAMKF
jgi:hypothetical protein